MPNKTSSNVAGIDGDVVVYRCGFAVEKRPVTLIHDDGQIEFSGIKDAKQWVKVNLPETYREEIDYRYERHHFVEPEAHALHAVDNQIESILADLHKLTGKKHKPRIYLSEGRSFREKVATIKPYKGNRDDKPQPVHKAAIREYLLTKYGAEKSTVLEADDLLAINGLAHGEVVCSIDKDLLQVPCTHYDWTTGQLVTISEDDGDYNLWAQIIAGDSTDNIQGMPGYGLTKAYKILDAAEEQSRRGWAKAAMTLYKEEFPTKPWLHWKNAFHETAKLVYLLRHAEDSWDAYFESIIKDAKHA